MIVVRIVIHESLKIAKRPSETTTVDELSGDLGSEAVRRRQRQRSWIRYLNDICDFGKPLHRWVSRL
ncbi:unnamed protein product [Macrosiphum euphorbiae]|uniref:Uncharacterized protein n=1 Tax=Macrosiphum euphorbiae TaxID=13131 RepID=A0AAV0WTU3_9HEMI|nr:unnamed protein product [Macrosiphum euphorbiae]